MIHSHTLTLLSESAKAMKQKIMVLFMGLVGLVVSLGGYDHHRSVRRSSTTMMLLRRIIRPVVQLRFASTSGRVNNIYKPGIPSVKCPAIADKSAQTSCISLDSNARNAVLSNHADREWSSAELHDAMRKHSLFTWGATNAMADAALEVVRGDGVYFHDVKGKKYLDFNSMAMCVNLGHTVHPSIIKAVKEQMETLAYAYPGVATTPIRAKLCKLLADITPGDINSFLFPSSGSEANEAAIRMARLYTGRHKIFTRYRSYHGGTLGSMALTGDQRRWPTEPSVNGVIHFFDPYPYSFSQYVYVILSIILIVLAAHLRKKLQSAA